MKLVIFDFDGVLVDTLLVAFSINKQADENLSIEKYKSFFEGNIYDAINAGLKKFIPDFDEQYRAQTRELKIPEVLKNMLQNLSLNYTLTLASSTPSSTIQEILEREGVHALFAEIFGSDVHKSKVVKIKMLLEKYKFAPEEAVFITDTVGDILEARECGVKSIAVTWGFHEKGTLQKANPERIVNTPEDLMKAIKAI